MTFDHLKAGGGSVEVLPQHERENRGERVESESDSAREIFRCDGHAKSAGQRNNK